MAARDEIEVRESARRRLVVRRRFTAVVMGYVAATSVLASVWTFTGTGSFWLTAPLSGLGAAVVLHSWDVFPRRPIADSDIDAEMDAGRSR